MSRLFAVACVLALLLTFAQSSAEDRRTNTSWLAMNNTGDTIDLVAPNGTLVDSISYESTTEGEEVSR